VNLLTIAVIALGLAMDAFAVSVTIGAVYKKPGIGHAFRTALTFGGFQAAMPVIGWLTGMTVRKFIQDYDHWAAFCLLAAIGCKMIYESFKIKRVQSGKMTDSNSLRISMLLALAVATSIDAFAVGITLSFLLTGSIAITVIIIGAVTFVLSYAGVYIGKNFGYFFANRIEALGGLVLLGIGTKILLEHEFEIGFVWVCFV